MCYFHFNSVNHVETSVQKESQEFSPKNWKSILSFLQSVSQSKKKKCRYSIPVLPTSWIVEFISGNVDGKL